MARAPRKPRPIPPPDLRIERDLLAEGHRYVGGLDEVGRGAWAGPLYVGVAVVDATTTAQPAGTNDSKMLTAKQRNELQPSLATWCASWALGIASSGEIDLLGLSTALRLAARRALAALPFAPTAVLVDGRVDFLTPRGDATISMLEDDPGGPLPEVHPVVHADRRCSSVAAASVLAKVARDDFMATLVDQHPAYGFEVHKGYGTLRHAEAIASLGLTDHHRRTWSFAVDPTASARRRRATSTLEGRGVVASGQ